MTNEQLLHELDLRLNIIESKVQAVMNAVSVIAENDDHIAVAEIQERLNKAQNTIRDLEYEKYLLEHKRKKGAKK